MTDLEILEARRLFPPLDKFVWFQNGGVSLTPTPVADYHAELMSELRNRGPMHIVFPDEEFAHRKDTVLRISRFFGAEPTQIAMMRGVSEAFQTVIRGISWESGDQIVVTVEEEAAIYLAALHLRDRHGVEVVTVPLEPDGTCHLKAFEEALTDRTRLIAFSHVTTDIGSRMPASAICDLARIRGILSFVDIAHSGGLFFIDLLEMGCDFAGALSYKWMYAPYASGLLFVREPDRELVAVTYAGGRSESKLDWLTHKFELKPGAEKYQFGPWSWPLIHAWGRSLDFLESYGVEAIWSRTCELTNRFKAGLIASKHFDLFTPFSPDDSAALVSFGIGDSGANDLRDRLREKHNIVIKAIYATRKGLRASFPFFLLEQEIDFLLEKLEEELI